MAEHSVPFQGMPMIPAGASIIKKIRSFTQYKSIRLPAQIVPRNPIVGKVFVPVISFDVGQLLRFTNTTSIVVEGAYVDDYKASENFFYSWKDPVISTSRTLACDGGSVYVLEDQTNNTLFYTGTRGAVNIKLVGVWLPKDGSYEVVTI